MLDQFIRPGYLGGRVSYTCEISGAVFAEGFGVSAEQARQNCRQHVATIIEQQDDSPRERSLDERRLLHKFANEVVVAKLA